MLKLINADGQAFYVERSAIVGVIPHGQKADKSLTSSLLFEFGRAVMMAGSVDSVLEQLAAADDTAPAARSRRTKPAASAPDTSSGGATATG